MRFIKPAGFFAAIVLVVAVFLPWVIIETRQITISGMNTAGTNYGKPGYLHLIFSTAYLILLLTPKLWSRRVNLAVGAFNAAWAFRNLILITACEGGECPVKLIGLYLAPIASVIMLLVVLFAPEKAIAEETKEDRP